MPLALANVEAYDNIIPRLLEEERKAMEDLQKITARLSRKKQRALAAAAKEQTKDEKESTSEEQEEKGEEGEIEKKDKDVEEEKGGWELCADWTPCALGTLPYEGANYNLCFDFQLPVEVDNGRGGWLFCF